jgi:protein-disulfide reductase (glutathione)
MDEAMPTDMAFYPDGSYVPRIFFLSPDGVVRHDVVNVDGDKRFKYFYGNEDHLIRSMETALKPSKPSVVVATPADAAAKK